MYFEETFQQVTAVLYQYSSDTQSFTSHYYPYLSPVFHPMKIDYIFTSIGQRVPQTYGKMRVGESPWMS